MYGIIKKIVIKKWKCKLKSYDLLTLCEYKMNV